MVGRCGVSRHGHEEIDLIDLTGDALGHKGSEFLLAESDQRFRSLIENASDLLMVLDRGGRLSYISPAVVQLIGYEVREMLGRNFVEFIHPDEAVAARARFGELLRDSTQSVAAERCFRHKDGHWVILETIAKNALDDPAINGIIVNAHDITQRKAAEAALAADQRRFRSLIENASDLLLVLDRSGLITYLSPSIKSLLGYEVGEGLGRIFLEFMHPDDAMESREVFENLIRSPGNPAVAERRFRHKDGHWVVLETIAKNTLDDPAVNGIVVNAHDVTQRKQAERDLKFKNTVLSTLQQTSLDAMIVVDESEKIISYNDQFVELWGISETVVSAGLDEAVVKAGLALVDEPEEFFTRVRYLYGHKEEKSREEFRFKDGRTIDRYSAPVTGTDGTYYGRVWYFRDITDRKTSDERIRKLNVLYATLSAVNHAIVRSTPRQELCQSICRIAVETGNCKGAWIGFVDEATRRIVPAAWSESLAPHINQLAASVDAAVPEGQGPTGISAHADTPYFCNDIFSDLSTLPWRPLARDFGVNAIATVPLYIGTVRAGVINLYSAGKDFYTPEVRALVVEMGEDISHALEMLKNDQLRTSAERTLSENESKYRAVAEQEVAGIYIIQDEKFVYANPYAAKIFGYLADELDGMPVEQLVAAPERALVRANIQARNDGLANPVQYSFHGRRKDGSQVDIGVHGSSTLYRGSPAVIGLLQDITERRRAEDGLRLFRALIDQSNDAITVADPETFRYLDVNEKACLDTGYSRAEILSMRVYDIDPDLPKLNPAALVEGLRKSGFKILEGRNKRKDGTTYPVEVSTKLVTFGREYIVAVIRDITERKHAEATLNKVNRALRARSACNELLVHAVNEITLLQDMCKLIVNIAGYRMAWAGFAEPDAGKSIRIVAQAGYAPGHMEPGAFSWGGSGREHGPAGTAVRTRKICVIQDARTDPDYQLRREDASRLGFVSVIALPLALLGTRMGVLCIYSVEADGFGEEETRLLGALADDLAFGIATLRAREEHLQSAARLRDSMEATITAMAATVEMRDPYTAGHQRRVALLAVEIARELGLPPDELQGVKLAAIIHDLGKIQVPAEILSKPTRLTDLEYQIIQAHPKAGYDILKEIDFPWPIAQIVYQHHERIDGSGYPRKLKDKDILIGAKILAVADTIEAMSSHRPYRPALGIDKALAEIAKDAGKTYDAAACEACLKLFREKRFEFPK